jgi:hypothetical protein
VTLNLKNCRSLGSLPAGLHTINPTCCSHRSPQPPFTLNHPRTARPNPPLSEGFGELRSLQTLYLNGCEKLQALPEGIPSNQLNLFVIHAAQYPPLSTVHPKPPLNQSTQIPLSKGFGELHSLVTLNLSYCESLGSLPEGLHTIDLLLTPISDPPFTLNHPCTTSPNRYSPKGLES